MPFIVNEYIIKYRHDLLAAITVHHYSQRNGVAMSKGEKTMKFKDPDSACKEMLLTEAP